MKNPRRFEDRDFSSQRAIESTPGHKVTAKWAINVRKTPPTAEEIWVAGLISIQGSFSRTRKNPQSPWAPIFRLRSQNHHEAMNRVAELADCNTTIQKDGRVEVTIYNKKLHYFMERLWPVLTIERRQEYLRLLKVMNND